MWSMWKTLWKLCKKGITPKTPGCLQDIVGFDRKKN